MVFIIPIIIICLGAVALTFFLYEKCKKYTLKATLIKSITSLLFISLAAYSTYVSGKNIGVYIIIALTFGLLGDVFLDLKYDFPSEDRLCTYAGFAVFAIGHIFYMVGMFINYLGDKSFLYVLIPIVAGFVLGTVNLFLAKPLKLKFGEYKWIACLYGSLLFCMTLSALSLSIAHSFQLVNLNMMMAGGVLFSISDLILSGTYFGEGKERPVDIITNGITYYMAQYVIAFSLMF